MVKDISEPINVPQAYLAKLLQQLVKGDVVSSIRGAKGGFYLTSDNMNKTAIDVINIIDGEVRLNSCMLSLEKCNNEKPCPLHNVLYDSKNNILKNLNKMTIKDLVQDVEDGKSFLPL